MVKPSYWDFYSIFYNPLLSLVARYRRQSLLRLSLSQPVNVYIAGCGSGLDLPYLPINSQVTAIDFSAKMLEKCQQQYQQLQQNAHPLSLTLRQGRAECSRLGDNSMDWVLLHLILSVTDQPQALLQEAIRVLKPGGRISIWDKFQPPENQHRTCRYLFDRVTRRLGTTINLSISDLLASEHIEVIEQHFMLGQQMRHIILQKPILKEY